MTTRVRAAGFAVAVATGLGTALLACSTPSASADPVGGEVTEVCQVYSQGVWTGEVKGFGPTEADAWNDALRSAEESGSHGVFPHSERCYPT